MLKRMFVGLGLLFGSQAVMAEVEFAVGSCVLGKSQRGSWWNDNYDTRIDLSGNCWSLGYRHGWLRVGYLDLGRGGKFANTMAVRDQDQFGNPDGSNCNPATFEGCIGRAIGKTHTYGVTLGAVKDWGWPALSFIEGLSTEAGVFAYRSGVKVSWQDQLGNKAYYDWAGYSATPYAGVGIKHKNLGLDARMFMDVKAHENGCGGCTGITQGSSFSLMLRASF